MLFTDVIVSGPGGPDLVAKLAATVCRGPVLYASG
jgi:hypothetical protein